MPCEWLRDMRLKMQENTMTTWQYQSLHSWFDRCPIGFVQYLEQAEGVLSTSQIVRQLLLVVYQSVDVAPAQTPPIRLSLVMPIWYAALVEYCTRYPGLSSGPVPLVQALDQNSDRLYAFGIAQELGILYTDPLFILNIPWRDVEEVQRILQLVLRQAAAPTYSALLGSLSQAVHVLTYVQIIALTDIILTSDRVLYMLHDDRMHFMRLRRRSCPAP